MFSLDAGLSAQFARGFQPSPFYGTQPLTQLAPPAFLIFLFPLSSFLFHPLEGISDNSPDPHAENLLLP